MTPVPVPLVLCNLNYVILMCHYMCDIFGVIMFGCSLMQPLSTRG